MIRRGNLVAFWRPFVVALIVLLALVLWLGSSDTQVLIHKLKSKMRGELTPWILGYLFDENEKFQESRCGACVVLVGLLWATEALPLEVLLISSCWTLAQYENNLHFFCLYSIVRMFFV